MNVACAQGTGGSAENQTCGHDYVSAVGFEPKGLHTLLRRKRLQSSEHQLKLGCGEDLAGALGMYQPIEFVDVAA